MSTRFVKVCSSLLEKRLRKCPFPLSKYTKLARCAVRTAKLYWFTCRDNKTVSGALSKQRLSLCTFTKLPVPQNPSTEKSVLVGTPIDDRTRYGGRDPPMTATRTKDIRSDISPDKQINHLQAFTENNVIPRKNKRDFLKDRNGRVEK